MATRLKGRYWATDTPNSPLYRMAEASHGTMEPRTVPVHSRLRERTPGWTSISSNASLKAIAGRLSVQDCPAPPNISAIPVSNGEYQAAY